MTQEEVKKLFTYSDGKLLWNSHRGSKKCKGESAGYNNKGYLVVRVREYGRSFMVHRLIWVYHNGDIQKGLEIDHINGIKNDNRIENLRLATRQQNNQNCKVSVISKSGIKGVHYDRHKRKWVVQVAINGKQTYLGSYEDIEYARQIAEKARAKSHGQFTNHG